MVLITGNTYPVKDKLKELGARWDADVKGWRVPDDKAQAAQALVDAAPKGATGTQEKRPWRPTKCQVCGIAAWDGVRGHPGRKILRSGECVDCYEERKMGY